MSTAHLITPRDVPGIMCSQCNSVNKIIHSNKSIGCGTSAGIHKCTGMAEATAKLPDTKLPAQSRKKPVSSL